MLNRRRLIALALPTGALPSFATAQEGANPLQARIGAGGCVVLWRHAQTDPGVGDPPDFKLAQCSTQRNLSASGRAQARVAGEWFKARGLAPTAVLSSAWCRCKDTADLAFGRHEVWSPLNSTFGPADRANEAQGIKAMRQRLAGIQAGRFEVWVTHQVNITGLTGEVPSMGEGLIVGSNGQVFARGIFS
ncbi:Histidine phosphatase family protein [Burkholderiales bacterium 8X]|nr:Histidine phosphatase family protein [Burkholderiales bacterium 8X]